MVDTDLCAYLRHKGNQRLLVAINRAYHPKTLTLPPEFAAGAAAGFAGRFSGGQACPRERGDLFCGGRFPRRPLVFLFSSFYKTDVKGADAPRPPEEGAPPLHPG